MPVWLRIFHINKISQFNKEQNEEMEKAQKGTNSNSSELRGPNIPPSSTYDF